MAEMLYMYLALLLQLLLVMFLIFYNQQGFQLLEPPVPVYSAVVQAE